MSRRLVAWVSIAATLGAIGAASPVAVEATEAACWRLVVSERVERQFPASGEEIVEERALRFWIGPRFVRQDVGEAESYLLDRASRRLIVVDHRSRTWQEYRVPVRIEDHLSAEEVGRLALAARRLSHIEAGPTTDARIEGWTATRMSWSAALDDVEVEVTWWVTQPAGVDQAAYWELARNVMALHPVHREWMAAIESPPGLPIRQVLEVDAGRFKETREWVVQSIESAAPAEAEFTIPEGYRGKPSRCFHHLSFGDDPACR